MLQRGLESTSPTLRAGSAQVAGRGNHPSLVPALARIALSDKDRTVRSQAIIALSMQARWRDLTALDGLIAIVDATTSSVADRMQAMQAIDEALTPLKRGGLAVDHPEKPVNIEESAGLWALVRNARDKQLGSTATTLLRAWKITGEDGTQLAVSLAARVGESRRSVPAAGAR